MLKVVRLLVVVGMGWGWSALAADSMTMQVKGMHCGGCENTIEEALKSEESVESVKADHKSGSVKIEFKDGKSLSQESVGKIIRSVGYKPVLNK